MPKMQLEPTATAQWYSLVRNAADDCGNPLDEPVEAYLVFMLMRFAGRTETGRHALALQFLAGLGNPASSMNPDQLRDTGDECLLVCGLFPQRVRRRRVPFRYYVDLGRGAYGTLASHGAARHAEPFEALAVEFVSLMEILQAMRGGDIEAFVSPVEAAEIARDTGSRHAWDRVAPDCGTLVLDPDDSNRTH